LVLELDDCTRVGIDGGQDAVAGRLNDAATQDSLVQFDECTGVGLSAPHVRNSRNSRSTKRGNPPPSLRSATSRKKVFQVLAHDAMEDGALRGPGLIRGDAHGRRASEARAVRGSVRRTAFPPWTARRTVTWI